MNHEVTKCMTNSKILWLLRNFSILFIMLMMCPAISFAEDLQVNNEKSELFKEANSLYWELLQFKDNVWGTTLTN